jgi:hypothetical protein
MIYCTGYRLPFLPISLIFSRNVFLVLLRKSVLHMLCLRASRSSCNRGRFANRLGMNDTRNATLHDLRFHVIGGIRERLSPESPP